LAVPSYLLRVQLEDRPGSLGSLAVALGSVGADILSLDVVERGAGYAIDDLVVELPAGAMPDSLITAAEHIKGVHVDSVRPHTGLLEAHRELELIDHIAAARTVVRAAGAGVECVAGSSGAPETQATSAPWLPLAQAEALDATADWVPQVWRDIDTALAAAPLGDPLTAVVLGRAGGPAFRPSEVARLGYLAGIVATILR
jgi:hypothetical protein